MRCANARDPPRRNLAALRDEGVEQPHLFVVNVVDPVHAEPAHFLAPEILLFSDRLVASSGPLGGADRSSAFEIRHVSLLDYSFGSAFGSACAASGRALSARAPGRPGVTVAVASSAGMAGAGAAAGAAGAAIWGAGLRDARFSRAFFRFSIFFIFSSMRTVMNLITRSLTRIRRSISRTSSGDELNCTST